MKRHMGVAVSGVAWWAMLTGAAAGLEGQPGPSGPLPGSKQITLSDLPPPIRLAAKAEMVRRSWPVTPVVVLVPDAASYAEAIGSWRLKGRFPVLIDDGSAPAHEDISRFVRAFAPERVVLWSLADRQDGIGRDAWPTDAVAKRERIERAMRKAWVEMADAQGLDSQDRLIARWKQTQVPSAGVVVVNMNDPAWTAGLALAAGRAEPLIWVSVAQGVNGALPLAEFGGLVGEIEAGCDRTGLGWKGLGDDVDAVALCLNAPIKVQLDQAGSMAALTDLVGRHAANSPNAPSNAVGASGAPGASGLSGSSSPSASSASAAPAPPAAGVVEDTPRAREKGERWAWAGQVFGSEAQAAYRAMCALFITTDRAWLFDGYPDTEPWNRFDCTKAGDTLRKAGWKVDVQDSPRQGERQWRLKTCTGIDAGLVLVNTKGAADEFELSPGACKPSDVPFLSRPVAAHIVHSWSAATPEARGTVAGRWLERGVYAYAGSVQEPFLTAFVPTPLVAARIGAPYPWGAAVRIDEAPAWKIAVIGDPLIVLGAPAPRGSLPLPLPGARDLAEATREDVAAKRYAQAITGLTMLGRDGDAAKLAAAAMREDPRAFKNDAAEAAIMPLFRAHDTENLVRAYTVLPADQAASGMLRDALWQVCYLELPETTDAAMLSVLRSNMRPEQLARDAAEIARPMARVFGRDVAVGMLRATKGSVSSDADRKRLDEAIERVNAGERAK